MPQLIAFLRAVNVGGRTVKMTDLCRLFEEGGASEVTSFLASGNILFASRSRNPAALEKKIETHLSDALGYRVDTFLRTENELRAITTYEPFTRKVIEAATAHNVGLLKEPLDRAQIHTLNSMQNEIDSFHTHNREVYWLCAKKQSASKFSNAAFEKALGVRVTFRTINTIQRLVLKIDAG